MPPSCVVDGVGDAGLHDQLQQAHVVEGRDLPRLVGLDVGVDQVPHVGLVGLEVEGLAAGLADDLAEVQVVVELLLDAARCRRRCSRPRSSSSAMLA